MAKSKGTIKNASRKAAKTEPPVKRGRGRPKGSKGIRQMRAVNAQLVLGRHMAGDPLAKALRIISGQITELNGKTILPEHVLECIKMVLPRLYPQLQSVEFKGDITERHVEAIESYVKRVGSDGKARPDYRPDILPTIIEVVDDEQT